MRRREIAAEVRRDRRVRGRRAVHRHAGEALLERDVRPTRLRRRRPPRAGDPAGRRGARRRRRGVPAAVPRTMEDLSQSGRTVIFVSHNMQAVAQLCDRAVLLDQGAGRRRRAERGYRRGSTCRRATAAVADGVGRARRGWRGRPRPLRSVRVVQDATSSSRTSGTCVSR